jgi:hypothetical protein
MREDMFEVIIERPRRGSRMGHPRRARRMDAKVATARDPDMLVSKLGMRRSSAFARSYKSLNENLAPLRRYLEKQVNRPWDKVWSEICENLSASSTVQQHVRDHVGDFVAYKTFVKDGKVFVVNRRGYWPMPLTDGHYDLYVDPRTGILRKNKHCVSWKRERREKDEAAARERATRMREIAPDTQMHKFEDRGWWEIKLAPIPTYGVPQAIGYRGYYQTYQPVTDTVLTAGLSDLPPAELYGRHGVYAVSKRQLSRKETAALGVREPRPPVPQRSR